MDTVRGLAWFAVGAIALAIVASGPLVSAVDLTERPDEASVAPGQGTVTVTAVDVDAGSTRFYEGRYGSETIYLDVPDARVGIEDVRGDPIVNYRVRIPALGTSRTQMYVPDEGDDVLSLEFERPAYDPDRITEDAYDVEIAVVVRDDDGARTVYQTTVSAEVER